MLTPEVSFELGLKSPHFSSLCNLWDKAENLTADLLSVFHSLCFPLGPWPHSSRSLLFFLHIRPARRSVNHTTQVWKRVRQNNASCRTCQVPARAGSISQQGKLGEYVSLQGRATLSKRNASWQERTAWDVLTPLVLRYVNDTDERLRVIQPTIIQLPEIFLNVVQLIAFDQVIEARLDFKKNL